MCPCASAIPGRINRAELAAPYALVGDPLAGSPLADAAAGAPSTHGLGVPAAIRLAAALDRVPRRLVVYAVEAADLSFGTGPSDPVAACLPELTRTVLAELTADGAAAP